MAKRVSPGEEKWNPVEAQLVGEVLRPETAVKSRVAEPPAPSPPRVVSIDALRAQAAVESQAESKDQDDDQANAVEQLTREKRVLLTVSEEDVLAQLVKDMGKRLGTSLQLSHVLRATVSLLMHSQDELLKQSERMGGLKRPPNHDRAGLATFEHNLARLVDRAIRGSRVLD